MKKIFILFFLFALAPPSFAKRETYDIINYEAPSTWSKEVTNTTTIYTTVNQNNNSWCRIGIIKSTTSKGNIEQDFDSEWQGLIVKNYKPNGTPRTNKSQEMAGWKTKTGSANFIFDKADAIAMLTTVSGHGRCASIVATTNSQEYIKDIEYFLSSVVLNKPETTTQSAADSDINNTSILGTWGISASDQSNYSVSNGINGYITRQYTFNADGTYNFFVKTFQYVSDKLLLTKENGTYQLNGNNLTITPKKSVIEEWSKRNGVDNWGRLLATQNMALEKSSYQVIRHYFSGIKEWSLVFRADKTTKRDGPYTGSAAFNNAWIYSTPCRKCLIQLPE
jgi:hypothetical protein